MRACETASKSCLLWLPHWSSLAMDGFVQNDASLLQFISVCGLTTTFRPDMDNSVLFWTFEGEPGLINHDKPICSLGVWLGRKVSLGQPPHNHWGCYSIPLVPRLCPLIVFKYHQPYVLPHEVRMKSLWNPYEIPMKSLWNPYEIPWNRHENPITNISLEKSHVVRRTASSSTVPEFAFDAQHPGPSSSSRPQMDGLRMGNRWGIWKKDGKNDGKMGLYYRTY